MTVHQNQCTTPPLPQVLAGPILRRCTPQKVVFWLATSTPFDGLLHIAIDAKKPLLAVEESQLDQIVWPMGKHCYIYIIQWLPDKLLPENTEIGYNFKCGSSWLTELEPDLLYEGYEHLSFSIQLNIQQITHGSCRKPHHPSEDGLVQLDQQFSQCLQNKNPRPDLLMMSGDQVYVDDVAGPMLFAIHQVIKQLSLWDEELSGCKVDNAQALYAHPKTYYDRDQLLPESDHNRAVQKGFWKGKKKPIFTSQNGANHLITFAEMVAMYLLTWSPVLWERINLDKSDLPEKQQTIYDKEQPIIADFARDLWQVRRVLAHVPTYMIFDDHDVTDDWNLTRAWEEASYSNPFSRRIIGNALLAYLLCQGWGNNPDAYIGLHPLLAECFNDKQKNIHCDDLISELLAWKQWHYDIPSSPPIIVLDTRTQRWRSESNPTKPSGLMDWESLCDLQQQLLGKPAVIMVSPSPIYGVKFIETVQKIFTFFGKALLVDAENWMAHKGTASVMLNIFRHPQTPPLFIILSGDVHYSFVYDITLKFSDNSHHICQITASGIKNQFPQTLLLLFDKLNRWLFHKHSPLNWLTHRRYMSIQTRKPPGEKGRTLINASGIGVLNLKDKQNIGTSIITASGETLDFTLKSKNTTINDKHQKTTD